MLYALALSIRNPQSPFRNPILPTSAFRLPNSDMVFIIAVKTNKGKSQGI